MKRLVKNITLALAAVFAPLSACASDNEPDMNSVYQITLTVNGHQATATMVANTATSELRSLLEKGNISVSMHDYGGFEKVGSLPQSFTRNDKPITTSAGDIMLYQGNQFVVFTGSNSWDYTPLGRLEGMTATEIKSFLGSGNITLTMSMDISGISDIPAEENQGETEYYDLSGRKVSISAKGIVIEKKNGKIAKTYRR